MVKKLVLVGNRMSTVSSFSGAITQLGKGDIKVVYASAEGKLTVKHELEANYNKGLVVTLNMRPSSEDKKDFRAKLLRLNGIPAICSTKFLSDTPVLKDIEEALNKELVPLFRP